MTQVKLLSTTVVLTALIWASADSLVNETATVYVSVDVVAAPDAVDMVVTPAKGAAVVEVQVSGPRAMAEKIRDVSPLQVRYPVTERPTGTTAVALDRNELKRVLSEQRSEFRKLTIVSIQPGTLPVVVDHFVTRDANVVLNGLVLAYDVEPQLERTTVAVRLRESRLSGLPTGEQLQIDPSGDLERLLSDRPPGQSVTVPITLDPSEFGPDAKAAPPTVNVTATVKAQRRTAEIATVPILIAVSFSNLEKAYRPVSRDGTPLSLYTQTIRVTGPAEAVDRLTRGTTRAYGIIHLKQEQMDALDTPLLVKPDFHLPPGIELAQEPKAVELRLVDIAKEKTQE